MSQNHILNNATSTSVHMVIVIVVLTNQTIHGMRYNTATLSTTCNHHKLNRLTGIVAIFKTNLIISYAIRNANHSTKKTKILFVASAGETRIG